MTLNVSKCLADAVTAGKLTAAQARDAESRVEALVAKGLPEADAVTRAAQEIGADAARKQRQAALRVIAAQRTVAEAEAHPGGFWQGVMAMLARDIRVRAGYSNVEGRAQAIVAEAHGRLARLLDAYRTKNLGFSQDLPGLRRFVRALYGDGTDRAASGFARAWTETTDIMVDRFNAAGGALANRVTWRLPQLWNREAVKRAGQGEFTTFMNAELERGGLRIVDPDTGNSVAPERAAAIIAKAYERIESNGVVDLVPGQPGGTSLANSRMDARAFEWTDADAWFRFNDRFGEGDAGLYDMLVGHVDGMGRDIAMLEILGPNPAHMVRYLTDVARQRGASATQVRMLENLWGTVNGRQASPVNEWAANLAQGVRSWMTSTQLGSAVLTSVTDFASIRQTAAWNGLPTTGVMQRYLSLLNPANAEDRVTAVRLGLIADGWTTRAMGAMRHQADIVGRDLAGRVADTVLRASGMSAHTQAAKWAFGMEFSAHLADRAGKTLAELEPEMQRTFGRYGISAEDWDVIRTRGVWEEDGVRFILPEQIVQGAPAEARAEALAIGAAVRVGGRPLAERRAVLADLRSSMAGWNLDRLYQNAQPNQDALTAALKDVAAEVQGTTTRAAPLKERETAAEKITRKGYADASQITDVVRGGLDVATPEAAEAIVDALARRFVVLDEGWSRTNDGYLDRKVLLRMPDGTVAEVQLWPPGMFDAKKTGGGHALYEAKRILPEGDPRARQLTEQMNALYSDTMAAAGPAWSDIATPGGGQLAAGTQARISASEVTRPLSLTSADATGTQPTAGSSMANAVPLGVSTAGRPSQYMNAIGGSPSASSISQTPQPNHATFNRATSRLLEMIQGETRFAVVEPGALERSIMLGGSRPGTLGGEFRRATAQYKSFPVAMMTRHLARAYDSLKAGDHGAYLATLAVGLTTMGAMAMQMKDIAQGRDPRDMNTPSFWGAAFMQGGGAGILGDFLSTGLNRADRGFYMTAIGGPTAGLVDDAVRLTLGNVLPQFATDQNSNFGRELARFAQRNTPGTSLWYSRLAVDRLMWERLQEMLDPQAPRRWRDMERRRIQDYDQEFFWRPGTTAPQRGPEIFRGD